MKKKAFTLIELLVVISIIALLVSILMPALGRAREQAKRVTCASQLKTTGIALNLYGEDNNYQLPDLADKAEKYPWRTYAAYWVNSDSEIIRPLGLGYLHSTGLIDTPEVFYCPSAKDWTFEQYNGNEGKPWPSTYASDDVNPIRTTYSYFPQHTSKYQDVSVFVMGQGFEERRVPELTYKIDRINPEKTVVTDRIHVLEAVPHSVGTNKGVNALFGDWHVGFCGNPEAFDEDLWHPGGDTSNGPGADAGIFRSILALLKD